VKHTIVASVPASTNTIADFPVLDTIACGDHISNNLMAWCNRAGLFSKSAISTEKPLHAMIEAEE
jgi:hypothetical protein